MKWSRIVPWGAAIAVVLLCSLAFGASIDSRDNIKSYLLFNGVNAADSSERASFWIPIRGAQRVYIRTWSAGATADTDFCDTVTTWKTLLSDSLAFMGRDSLGTLVTAAGGIPRTTSHSDAFPVAADSVVITNQLADSVKMVAVINPVEGVGDIVRGSATGSGRYTIIMPNAAQAIMPNTAGGTASGLAAANEIFMTSYLRIRITPRTRLTTAGFSSTAGLRTRGLNKLKMIAYVVYPPASPGSSNH